MSFNNARRTSSHPPLAPVPLAHPTPPEPTTSQVPSAIAVRHESSSSSSLWPTLGVAVRDRAAQKLEAGKRKAEGQPADVAGADKKAKCVQAAHRRPPAAHAPLAALLEDASERLAQGTLDAQRIGAVLQQCAVAMTEDEPLTALGACLAEGLGGSAMTAQTAPTAVQALFAGIASLDGHKTRCVVQGFIRSLGGLTLRTGLLQRLVEVLRPLAAQSRPGSPAHIALQVLCASQCEGHGLPAEGAREHKGEQDDAPQQAVRALCSMADRQLHFVGTQAPGVPVAALADPINNAIVMRFLAQDAAMPSADRARLVARIELIVVALQPCLQPDEDAPAGPAACAQRIDALLAEHRHATTAQRLNTQAQALGWRLGLHSLPRAAQAQVIEHAVDRLRETTTDLERQRHRDVLLGLIAAIARPPGALVTDVPALQHCLQTALARALANAPEPASVSRPAVSQALQTCLTSIAAQVGFFVDLPRETTAPLITPLLLPVSQLAPDDARRWLERGNIVYSVASGLQLAGRPQDRDAVVRILLEQPTESVQWVADASLGLATAIRSSLPPGSYAAQLTAMLTVVARSDNTVPAIRGSVSLNVLGGASWDERAAALLNAARSMPLREMVTLLGSFEVHLGGPGLALHEAIKRHLASAQAPTPPGFAAAPLSPLESLKLAIALARVHGAATMNAEQLIALGESFQPIEPPAGPASPPVDAARLQRCRRAIAIAVDPMLVFTETDLSADEQVSLFAALHAQPGQMDATRTQQLFLRLLSDPMPTPDLRLQALSAVMPQLMGLLRLQDLRLARRVATQEHIAIGIEIDTPPPLRDSKGASPARGLGQPGAMSPAQAGFVRSVHAGASVAALYESLQELPAIAWLYAPQPDTGHAPLDLQRVRAQEAVLREHLAFLDAEILEITQPHVPQRLRDDLLAQLHTLREPLRVALQAIAPAKPLVPAGAGKAGKVEMLD